jgi:hypothetical protein
MRLVCIKESKLYKYPCGSQYNSTLHSFIFHAFEFFCAEYLDCDVKDLLFVTYHRLREDSCTSRMCVFSHACLLHCRRLRWLPHLNHRAAQLYSICQSTQKLMASSEKSSDEVKIHTLHRIIIAAGNGNPQVRFVVIAL